MWHVSDVYIWMLTAEQPHRLNRSLLVCTSLDSDQHGSSTAKRCTAGTSSFAYESRLHPVNASHSKQCWVPIVAART